MGDPTLPPVVQHLNPDTQSLSAPHGAPAAPLPVMQPFVAVVSLPAW